MPDLNLTRASLRRTWRWFRWRSALLMLVFACGLTAFMLGVQVSDRADVAHSDFLAKAYYTIGLFVLGGLDLGVPIGGPTLARGLLWASYFAAPAITASAVVEGILRAIRPRDWALRRMEGHVVIAGCGKLSLQLLARLRDRHPRKPVIIVETRADVPNLDEARDVYGAFLVAGDVSSDVLLSALRLPHADRVFLLTGDDFTNLDAAAKIVGLAPELEGRVFVHVSNLHFMRVLGTTSLNEKCVIFNTHQIAARHLVESRLLEHFQRTEPLDTVVIAGFGRFGQTVLDELQTRARGRFDRLILVDVECQQRAEVFQEQVGFADGYARECVNGDLNDPEIWRRLDERYRFAEGEPAFVLGSGEDGTNMHVALWLQGKYPNAYVVARSFRRSTFAEEVSKEAGFDVFAVAELLHQSIPDTWLG